MYSILQHRFGLTLPYLQLQLFTERQEWAWQTDATGTGKGDRQGKSRLEIHHCCNRFSSLSLGRPSFWVESHGRSNGFRHAVFCCHWMYENLVDGVQFCILGMYIQIQTHVVMSRCLLLGQFSLRKLSFEFKVFHEFSYNVIFHSNTFQSQRCLDIWPQACLSIWGRGGGGIKKICFFKTKIFEKKHSFYPGPKQEN